MYGWAITWLYTILKEIKMKITEFEEEEIEMIENEALSVKYEKTLSIEFPVKKVNSDPNDRFSNRTVSKPEAIGTSIHYGMEYGVNTEIGSDKTLAYVKEKVNRKINNELNQYQLKFTSISEQGALLDGKAV